MTDIYPGKSKFDPRARPCVFMGCPFSQKGYKVFDLTTHSVHIRRDVIFREYVFPYKESSGSTIVNAHPETNLSVCDSFTSENDHDPDFAIPHQDIDTFALTDDFINEEETVGFANDDLQQIVNTEVNIEHDSNANQTRRSSRISRPCVKL